MREIKFRAWDNQENRMVYPGEFVPFADSRGEMLDNFEDRELMQYTGLKDKNLKEIYFGDILATSNQDKDYDIWEKEDYGYTVVEENIYELGIVYSKWHMTYDVESIYHFRFCEVIGNIYENPELLSK